MIAKLRINPHFLPERLRPGRPGLRGAYIGEAVRCRKRWMGELHEGQVRTNKTSAPTTHSNAPPPRPAALDRAPPVQAPTSPHRSEEHTSELQSQSNLVCRL